VLSSTQEQAVHGAKEGDSIFLDLTPEQVRRYAECKLVISVVDSDAELEMIESDKVRVVETVEGCEEVTPTIRARKIVFRYMLRNIGTFLVQLQFKQAEEQPALFTRLLKSLTSSRKPTTDWKFTKPFLIEITQGPSSEA
jgi:hypothetical protein